MQKPIASLMVVGLLVLAACGTGGEVEPGPITSFEDIAGIYKRGPGHPPIYLQFTEDGTLNLSSNHDLVEERTMGVMETRFEGTKVFLKEIKSASFCGDNPEAIYEIHLLENGNLQFVAIENKCPASLRGL